MEALGGREISGDIGPLKDLWVSMRQGESAFLAEGCHMIASAPLTVSGSICR